ncbi:MAG: glycosyltransferase family 39 protein [Chloroflexi bacterium]|nr:glycosyltransferase family 39 protein [Chloroflexota bacterium]
MDAELNILSVAPPADTRTRSAFGRAITAARSEGLSLVAIGVIVAVAVALRFYGLDWDAGFPYTPHPDERAILFRVADLAPPPLNDLGVLLNADESPWNPRWFPYGSFPLYMMKGIELASGVFTGDGITDLRVPARAMSALADVVTVIVVYLLGRAIFDRRTGLFAAALLSLSVIHIQLSHFFAVDTLLALFAVASLYFMVRVAREGRPRDSALAGLLLGIGMATKVSLAPIFAAFVVAHLMYLFSLSGRDSEGTFEKRLPKVLKALGVGFGVSLVVFFVAQPYAFLDYSRFFSDVSEQSEMVRRIRDYPYTRQYADTLPYIYQLRQLATWGLGLPLGIVAWAGVLFASLRGLPRRLGAAYIAIGWLVPAGLLLWSNSFPVILVASGIAVATLLATLPVRTNTSRINVLLLAWVVPYFLITGSLQVKFMRYMIPITPFLVLFGSQMVAAAWDRASRSHTSRRALRPALALAAAFLVGVTGFYAIAYTNVYGQTHTAVRASEWLVGQATEGSQVLKEHWEEAIPNLDGHTISELQLYDDDSPSKFANVARKLADSDYIVFFSNRLYGTIPRLPERYHTTTPYYELLFTERLGYRLVHFEATYPRLMGVGFVDETFARPNLPTPVGLENFNPSPITLNLGHADESFTVYDHPKVLIFQNIEGLDESVILGRIQRAARTNGQSHPADERPDAPPKSPGTGLMLSREDAEAQQAGGTWTDIVSVDGWTNRMPVLGWLVAIQGIALLTVPLGFVIFRPLPDRGYLFSKILGLMLVGLIVWLLASFQWVAFSRGSIALALVVVAAASLVVLRRNRREMLDYLRRRWSVLAISEAVFMAAFLAFVLVRMANPDLWHPWRGGEKPMDLAYLNAVLRSSYMPPYDPWFAGGYINYYYWGQFLTATLIRVTSINPAIAFNLAVPTFFALTVGGAFSLVYNLAESTRRRLASAGAACRGRGLHWSPAVAGIGAALFVTVLGNLDGAIQVGHGVKRVLLQSEPFGQFDFWRSSRMMPPDPPGHEITEFPFFTFLFGDLHAHMMAMPFTLLSLGIGLAIVMAATNRIKPGFLDPVGIGRLVVVGVAVGSLRLINAWDFPTYLIIAVAAILLAEFFVHGGFGLVMLARAGLKATFMAVAGYVFFLPFHQNYETFFNGLGIESTTNTTVLWQFLAISGLFIFIIGSFVMSDLRHILLRGLGLIWRRYSRLRRSLGPEAFAETEPPDGAWGALATVAIVTLAGFALTAAFTSSTLGSTVPFVAALLVLVLISGVRRLLSEHADSPQHVFVAIMVSAALLLVLGLDFLRVESDIDRMNSIFKFYLQVWVLLALASAYLLWRLGHGKKVSLLRLSPPKKAWVLMLVSLIASASIYPILGTQDRLRDRFNDNVTPLTLDGAAYIDDAVYRDANGDIELAKDYDGIQWLKDNVQGSPVVLEGVTPTYRWGGRVSINTGLPTVVGWQWHQEQQRWDYRQEVGKRIRDVQTIYDTQDPQEAMSLLRRYGVRYVYVGKLEQLYFSEEGLRKFDDGLGGELTKVFQNDDVSIYRLTGSAF